MMSGKLNLIMHLQIEMEGNMKPAFHFRYSRASV